MSGAHEADGLPHGDPKFAEFAAECERFLAARYRRKPRGTTPFAWGVGSDRVGLFEEAEREEERARVAKTRAWRRSLWDAGLGWITGPMEYGGRGLSPGHQRVFDRAARGYAVPGNAKVLISLGMVAPTVLAHGTPAARRRYLAAMHAGDLIACQLFSEPSAGSDLASVSTRAARDGAGWRITGQKVWSSGAHYADIGEVLCRTSHGPRHRNLTAFIVDMRAPGVEVRPLRQMTGGAAFNEVFLTDVWVPDDDRLGEVGGGWEVALTTLSSERSSLGDEGFGGFGVLSVERYREMVTALGGSGDPLVRDRFADLVIHLRVAKYRRARLVEGLRAGRPVGNLGTLGKVELTANLQRICDFVSEVLGPKLAADSGEWGTYAWADLILGTPGMRIGGGTDEIVRNIIAEKVLGLPKE